MRLAIMQPYFFPYIGYFQLIHAADKFVTYDDGKFRKYGWINRNRILVCGRDHLFTVPLVHPSYHTMIKDINVHRKAYQVFKVKFSKQIRQAYAKAPLLGAVHELVQQVLDSESESMSRLAVNSLKSVCRYLDIETPFVDSSVVYENNHLAAQSRVLDICGKEGANVYINPLGGTEFYQKDVFAGSGIELLFLKPKPISYRQYDNEFLPWLSIIDVLMFNPVEAVRAMLGEYELV
jgi:hypothetical protein